MISDTLIILAAPGADGRCLFHMYIQMLRGKIYRCQDGKVGVSLTASGAAIFTDAVRGFCGHPVAQSPGG